MENKEYIIEKELIGTRLDKCIVTLDKEISRVTVQRLLDEQNILVNGKKEKASYKVNLGDTIHINKPKAKEISLKAEQIPIDILYEDNDIIIVNKPKGMVVHPANGNPDGTLVNAIMNICKKSLSGIGGKIRPGIVHRLDKDTSGVIIIAKNDKAHIDISEQIKNRTVKKIYIALVRGSIKEEEATIDMPIGRSEKDRKKMAVTRKRKRGSNTFQSTKKI